MLYKYDKVLFLSNLYQKPIIREIYQRNLLKHLLQKILLSTSSIKFYYIINQNEEIL